MLTSLLYVTAVLYLLTASFHRLILIGSFIHRAKSDDTDPKNGRSGLILYTDCKTGVQYVGTVFGGLVRRCTVPDGVTLANPNDPHRPWRRGRAKQ